MENREFSEAFDAVNQVNKGLRQKLSEAREKVRALGENYPIFPEDFFHAIQSE